jgi:hypothetical protein
MARWLLAGVAMASLVSPMSMRHVKADDSGEGDTRSESSASFHRCVDDVPKGSRLQHSMGGFWYYTPDNLEEAQAWRDGIVECRRVTQGSNVLDRGRARDAAVRKAAGY